jgi:Spy/CpxP family protein refolding chaperone
MKPNHVRITTTAVRAIAAGMFVAAFALGTGSALAAHVNSADRTEMRIKDMHAKLKITPEQEDQWQQVAKAMRDNEVAIEPLIEDRKSNARTMTAIDDLHSYAAITQAHLDGITRLTPAFEKLYAGMSDTQKQEADHLFRGPDHKKSKAK